MPTPEEEAAAKAAAERAAADKAAADAKAAEDAAKAAKASDDEKLGDAGKKALVAERDRANQAEKRARDAEAELKKIRDEKLSETERLKQENAEAKKQGAEGRKALRNANLLVALQVKGVANPRAAARLLDGVKYDDDRQEPLNLDDAITAAKTEFGDAMFRAAKTPAADINSDGGGGGGGGDGPKLNADEKEAARSFGQTDAEYAWYRDNPTGGVYKPAEPAKT